MEPVSNKDIVKLHIAIYELTYRDTIIQIGVTAFFIEKNRPFFYLYIVVMQVGATGYAGWCGKNPLLGHYEKTGSKGI